MFNSFNNWISITNISVLIFAIVSSYLGIKIFIYLVEVCCLLCKPFILRKKAPSWKRKKKGLIFLDKIIRNLQSALVSGKEVIISSPFDKLVNANECP